MRLFEWLLRLLPRPLRREYADAMAETFERRLADARRLGIVRCLRLVVRESAGVLWVVIAARRWKPAAKAPGYADARKAGQMDVMAREIRHAARRLLRAPAFTAAAVSTLALAIAANVAIFAVVERVVLNPLPFPDSDRVLRLEHQVPRVPTPRFAALPQGLYLDYAERARTLAAVAAYQPGEMTLTGNGDPERVSVARVTRSLHGVLQVSPQLGRWFTAEEDAPGGPQVAVLSHGLWSRRFARDPTMVGRTVALNGTSMEVVGVMPPSFAFPDSRVAVWMPEPLTRAAGFGLFTHGAVARLRDGATIADARNDLDAIIASLPQSFPGSALALSLARGSEPMRSLAISLKEATVGDVERALWILMGSVGVVLLVACANVANLFLARSEVRRREVAVRQALGAGRAALVRFFLAESALLTLAGAVLGVTLAWVAVRLLVTSAPATLPRLEEIRLTGIALAFTSGLSIVTAIAFATAPMLQRVSLLGTLHESGRGTSINPRRHRARQLLMAAQTALALVLLVASGLLIRSFQHLRSVDPGFEAGTALAFRVGLPARTYGDRDAAVAAHRAIIDRLKALPEAAAVSATTCLPLEGTCFGNGILLDDGSDRDRPPQTSQPRPVVMFRAVAADYFEVIGTPVIRGRTLSADDLDSGRSNVVVNQRFVDAYFPGKDPIGQRIASSRPPTLPPPAWLQIVGIVANTPTNALAEAAAVPLVYMPMSIASGPGIPQALLVGPDVSTMNFVVRAKSLPSGMLPSIRRALDGVDPELAIADARTLASVLDRASSQMAFTMALVAIAGGITLLLGLVGIYGVTSYIVSQRTGEIGVRLALGADPRAVAAMILAQGGRVVIAGAVVGLAIAAAGTRVIESVLYAVRPRDPAVFISTTLLLTAVALLACWIPARRASRLSPVEALRQE
jgi:putative ABC transport system permease protein